MEEPKTIEEDGLFLASYFTDDRGCAHEKREHTLLYLQKRVKNGEAYHSIVLKFFTPFLKEFYHTLNRREIPFDDAKRDSHSVRVLPRGRADIRALFESLLPFFEMGQEPMKELIRRRLEAAHDLLVNGEKKVTEACFTHL